MEIDGRKAVMLTICCHWLTFDTVTDCNTVNLLTTRFICRLRFYRSELRVTEEKKVVPISRNIFVQFPLRDFGPR